MNYVIFTIFFLIILWIIILYIVYKKKSNYISLYGPTIMLKTERGKKFIQDISKHRIWDYYGIFSIIFLIIGMVFTVGFLIWEAIIIITIPRVYTPSPLSILGIPGINPYIPVLYGIIALIVAVVLHEFSHGIESARNNVKIKSLGVLLLIIPVGAFVEPDEEQLKSEKSLVRMKIFSSGPVTNLILAIISLLIMIMIVNTSVPVSSGAVILSSSNTSLMPGDIILKIDNMSVNSTILNSINLNPGKNVSVLVLHDGKRYYENVMAGIYINSVLKNSPAYISGMKPGMVLIKMDGYILNNITYFQKILYRFSPGERVNFTVYYNKNILNISLLLIDKYSFYEKYYPSYNNMEYKSQPFIGIVPLYMNITYTDPESIYLLFSRPFSSGPFNGFLHIISLPFSGLEPLPSYLYPIFITPINPGYFWFTVNVFYWLFWINLMLGLTNLLPLIPLDGGYLFRDLFIFFYKDRKDYEKFADKISTVISFFILFLLIWQIYFLYF
ncbi:MAG: site-2 protease family protein [Thermoplasmata archaeon]